MGVRERGAWARCCRRRWAPAPRRLALLSAAFCVVPPEAPANTLFDFDVVAVGAVGPGAPVLPILSQYRMCVMGVSQVAPELASKSSHEVTR